MAEYLEENPSTSMGMHSCSLYETSLTSCVSTTSVTLKSIYECPLYMKMIHKEEEYIVRIRELEQRTGYKLSQKCGQRIYSDPPYWVGPAPPRGSEVFLSIERNVYEYDLEPILSQFGQIYDLRLMVDFSGTNRGFAYVRYASPQIARQAVFGLNNLRGKRGAIKRVVISDDNCELFVSGLPLLLTRDELYEHFSRRTERLVSVTICPSRIYNTPNRGFAFLEYANHSLAAQARRELLLDLYVQEWRTDIAVNWSIPDKLRNNVDYTPVKTIHVGNIPTYYCTHRNFSTLLAQYCETHAVTNIRVFQSKAFVEFSTRDEANYALHLLEGVKIMDKTLHVNWARPMQRSKERDLTLQRLSYSNAARSRSTTGSISSTICTPTPGSSTCDTITENYQSGSNMRAEAPEYPANKNNHAIAISNHFNFSINQPRQDTPSEVVQDTSNMQPSQTVTNPRYRGTTPLPNIMPARFNAMPNVNFGSSVPPLSPAPVSYVSQFNHPQWSAAPPISPTILTTPTASYSQWSTGTPISPTTLLNPSYSPAFVYPSSISPFYTPGILSPVPRSPTTPVFTDGNFLCNYF